MKTIKLYEYWDSELQKTVRSRIPKDPLTDLNLVSIIADTNKYLQHKHTGAIRSAITVPVYLQIDWEEKTY